jgi:tRNA U38,U39,U40 pseudouridine synthase TruA
MISLEINKIDGIVIIEPSGALEQSDFEELTKEIDDYIHARGVVNGIIIHTKAFPGWEDFSAFQHHMKFVKDHHRKIKRVAVVTDSKVGSIVPHIAKHFVSADIKHFEYESMASARTWIKGAV